MQHEMNAPSETKRFFLGDDSDSDNDSDHDEPKRRFSLSDSDCSDDDDAHSVVGGPPSAFNFDEDSGLGISLDGSSPTSNGQGVVAGTGDSSQIIPLPPVSIGSGFMPKSEQKPYGSRRAKRYHFKDHYEMKDDHLGSGAYASVVTCVSVASGKEFAVKLVNKHEPGHTRSRILREVEIFKMCKGHPNFVQLIEWFEDEDYFYMVFEKMYGGPLLNHIQRKVCFTEKEAALVVRDIATALKFLHSKGVAHRDLKPENILCTELDRVSPVKLCDFDLASKPSIHGLKRRASRQLHNVQSEPDLASPVGSAEFLAPEVVETFVGESLRYDRRCDLWSLGVIIYIMLCGYVPFYGECSGEECEWANGKPCDDCQENLFERIQQGYFEFPDEEWANISDEAKDLISHLLVKNVKQRFTAQDVLAHPWISNAPKTALRTANNLFRNNSSKDIQQFNDHFNFASRLSSRVEEVIPSLGSTPENESSAFSDTFSLGEPQDYRSVDEVIAKATELLASQQVDSGNESSTNNGPLEQDDDQQPLYEDDSARPSDQQQHQHYEFVPTHQHMAYPMPPPPLISMNGMLIYAPPMAPQNVPPPPAPQFYYQHAQQQMPAYMAYPPNYAPNQGLASAPYYLNQMEGVEMQANCPRNVNAQIRRNRSSDPLAKVRGEQPNQGSLSSAISQLGLETCQNAIVRQNSSGKEIHHANHPQSREAQVNV